MQFLEDNVGENLDDLEYDHDYWDKIREVGSMKKIIDVRGPNAGAACGKEKMQMLNELNECPIKPKER